MDHFEAIAKTLLEAEGYWVRQSFKVNLTKEEKRRIGKPSIPRPEIDLLAYRPGEDTVIALEAKSFLDSYGVRVEELQESYEIPEGRYKLFTCANYRNIVFARLRQDLLDCGMGTPETQVKLGLVTGKVYRGKSDELRTYMQSQGWLLWSPEEVRQKVLQLASMGYENEPAIITAKILLRGAPDV